MLTVIMASYNGAATLPKVLQAYTQLSPPPQGWRIVIADNASTDGTCAVIRSFQKLLPLEYVFAPRRGKNAALNIALSQVLATPGDGLLVFTDDDVTPQPDWLRHLHKAAQSNPTYSVFGGSIVADWARTPPPWLLQLVPLGLSFGVTDPCLPDGPIFPGLVWGANMAIRRSLFDAGIRFEESIGPTAGGYAMGGETELTRRLHEAGHLSWFCPAAGVAHYIRAAQMQPGWLLRRAWRFGRGAARQSQRGQVAELCGIPRWMLRRSLCELAGLGFAALRLRRDLMFRHAWELSFLGGYLRERWRRTALRGPRRVFITSYSGELGGMELRMAQEARFLNAGGYHSTLGLRDFAGADGWMRSLQRERIAVRRFDPPPLLEQWRWRHINRLRAAWWGVLQLRRQRADLVHVALCWSSYGTSALWLAHRCALPAIISVHNAFPPVDFSRWHRPLLQQAFSAVRGVYAVSESALQHFLLLFQGFLPRDTKLAVIPNCVDTEKFRPSVLRRVAARQTWGLPPDALVIGSVGRLSEQKQPAQLLQLLVSLRRELDQVYLVLAGSGPLEQELRRVAELLAVRDHVVFTGYVEQVELLMPAFDVHILLSRREGFGIATIEAMACGVPALASNVPGSADILRDSAGGMLLPADDAARAACEVCSLLCDPLRRASMAKAGRAEVEQRYGVEKVQDLVHAFYRGLV